MTERLKEEFMENKFIGMMFIMVCTIGGLVGGLIDQETFKTTMLFSFAIFAGANVVDGKFTLSYMKQRDVHSK